MKKELLSKLKKMKGNLLVIGTFDEKVIKIIEENDNITICNSLQSNDGVGYEKTKRKGKKVNIKRIRRVFKKKAIDYIICDLNELNKYLHYFIKDSIYLCKKEVIFSGDINEDDLEVLTNRYNRYNVSLELKKDKTKFLLVIDVSKAKNNRFKDRLYFIKDSFSIFSNFMTDFLTH